MDLAAIQRKLLALQRGVSDSAANNPASDGVTSELDDEHEADNLVDLKKIEVMQSGIEERKMGIGDGAVLGVFKMVLSGTRYAASSFFIHNSTWIYYAARVANLNSLAQLINIIVLYSFV